MRELGICKNSGRIYEGSRNAGIPVLNNTPLLPVDFIGIDKPCSLDEFGGVDGFIFREDSFDPITKIRRGRIYKMNGSQPTIWRVQDPSRKDLDLTSWSNGSAQTLEAVGYNVEPLVYLSGLKQLPKVVLGKQPFHSFWKILSIETRFDGCPLIILKALSANGTVPELIEERLPSDARKLLVEKVEDVEVAANRLGPIETVDACRSTLSVVLGALAGNLKLDLGAGITGRISSNKKLNSKSNGQDLITHNAEIVRRLHSRGKPNEMVKHETRPISDEDANLALRCLWFVLVELGWAKDY